MLVVPGVPLRGMVPDNQGRNLQEGQSPKLLNVWREQGELRARFGLTSFAANSPVTAVPVQKLFFATPADGSTELIRIDENEAHRYDGTNWATIAAGAPDFTGTATTPYGVAMALNTIIFSNGIQAAAGNDGVFQWDGAVAAMAQIAASGLLAAADNGFRYVTQFANRVIGAYTANAASGPIRVIGSAPGSFATWTLAAGAFIKISNEHPSYITGLSSDDAQLLVWKERAIVVGTETGDDDFPIQWDKLRQEGFGLYAPQSLQSYAGFHLGYSQEGFFIFTGGAPQFIDADIKRDFAKRVNAANLLQMHSMIMPEYNKAVFFVPEGDDIYPRNAWVYDWALQSWDRWSFPSHQITAAVRATAATGNVIDAYGGSSTHIEADAGGVADITGGNALIDTGLISGAIINSLGTTASDPTYILGDHVGETFLLGPGAADDVGTTFPMTWETPDFDFVGQRDDSTRRLVTGRDMVTADEAVLSYQYSGSALSVEVAISTDKGVTWVIMETKTLTATVGGYGTVIFNGRITGRLFRARIHIASVVGQPSFENLSLIGQLAGGFR